MRKGRTVIGQDVYSLADGLRVQSVKDLIVNESHDAIVALLVDEGGLLGTSTIVPIEAVHRFGPDAVTVAGASAVVPASSDERVAAILDRRGSLVGTPVVTTEGKKVGSIGDMYFDERSGEILGYEVSGGTVGDVVRGTSWLPLEAIDVIGPDAVIARPDAAEIVDSQVGGLTAALQDVQQRAAGAGEDVGERLRSSLDGSGDEPAEAPEDPVARDPDGALVGRTATSDVVDADGAVVVASGQRVTLEHVQRARAEGGLDALYAGVGLERPVPVSEQVAGAARSAAETAGDLWNRFTQRLSEMSDDAGRRMDRQQTKAQLDRINDAIGRPVTKVFLDREDTVILDLGDLITHQAVQRAYEAGMLDSLLGSVYRMDVSFSQEQLRAPVRGDSTIEQAHGGATVVEALQHEVEAAEDEASAPASGEGEPATASKEGEPATASAPTTGRGSSLGAEGPPDRTAVPEQAGGPSEADAAGQARSDAARPMADQARPVGIGRPPMPEPGAMEERPEGVTGTEPSASGEVRDQHGMATEAAVAGEEARQDSRPPV